MDSGVGLPTAAMMHYPRAILNAPVPPTTARSMAPVKLRIGPSMASVLLLCSPAMNTKLIADCMPGGLTSRAPVKIS